jgi:cysteine desulfurase/selenocysteine lyase
MTAGSFGVAAVRAQIPLIEETERRGGRLAYLDNAATAQVPRVVLDAVMRHETTTRANVLRGVYALAEAANAAYQAAREAVARYLNGDADEVVFTGGATAALNLVAYAFGETLAAGDEVVVSELEHHSNLVPWQLLARRRGIVLKVVPVTDDGRLELDALPRLLGPRTRLLALTHASNVTGAVTDAPRVAAAARAAGARFLLDGAQMAPHGRLDVRALGCDFYAFSGHKCFGPTGVGVLWGRREALAGLPPFMAGGGMVGRVSLGEGTTFAEPPRRFEAGTPPIAQAIGLGAALDWIAALGDGARSHVARLTRRLIDGLHSLDRQRGLIRLVGPADDAARIGVVSFHVEGMHPHDICQVLDAHGVCVRGGHHCAQPLMERFGISGATRASLAPYNDDADVDALLAGLDAALNVLR